MGAERGCSEVPDLGFLGVQTPALGVCDQVARAAVKMVFNSKPVFSALCRPACLALSERKGPRPGKDTIDLS